MAEFEIGQTFLDLKSTNLYVQKAKYFISLSSADNEDDEIVCFVMNTENKMEKYHVGCNRQAQKFILLPDSLSFIINPTSIMLAEPARYYFREIYENNIKLLDKADLLLCRQIKNCINWDYISVKFANLIDASFKDL